MHRGLEPKQEYLDNLVCRILQDCSFNQAEALSEVKGYLEFEKTLRDKYSADAFEKYDKMKIFEWMGHDKEGRLVVQFNIRNNRMSQITDHEKYLDYFSLITEFWAQDRMKGWADEAVVLSDARDFTMDSFHLGVLKGVVDRCAKMHTFTRPCKIIAYNNGFLTKSIVNVLKSILPTQIVDMLVFLGSDEQEITE